MTKVDYTAITGLPLADGWSHVFFNDKLNLTCSLAIKGKNAKNIGHEVIDLINSSPLESINQLHNLLLDILTKLRDIEAEPQIAITWLPANTNATLSIHDYQAQSEQTSPDNQPKMVLAAYKGRIILKRNQKIGVILQAENDIQLIQGSVKDGDELILMTQQADQIEQSLRQQFKQSTKHDSIKTQLKKKIEMLVDSSLTSIALIKLRYEQVKVEGHRPFLFTTGKKSFARPAQQEAQLEIQTEEHEEIFSEQKITDKNTSQNQETNQAQEDVKIKINLEPIKKFGKKAIQAGKKTQAFLSPLVKSFFNKAASTVKKKPIAKLEQKESIVETPSEPQLDDKNSTDEILSFKTGSGQTNSDSKKKLSITRTLPQINLKKTLNFFTLIKLPFKRAVYLDRGKPKKAFKIFFIILCTLLLLGAGAWYVRHLYQNQHRQAQAVLAPAQQLLASAQELMHRDIVLARDKTATAIEIIAKEQKEFAGNRFTRSYFEEELEKAHIFFIDISGMIEMSQLEIFFDLREQAANFITSAVDLNSSALFLLDRELKQTAVLNLQTRQLTMIDLGDLTAKNITASEERLFFIGSGIHYSNLDPDGADNTIQELKSEGDSDRDAIFIDFFEGYLYIFNPDKRNIYRYIVQPDGLSEPIGWLTNKQGIKFDQVTSMAVDGFIWLTDNTGKIFKLERGEPVEFAIKGLEEEFGSSIKLFADSNTEYIYILEPEKKRLVVLSKEGDFIKQITHQSLAGATFLAVNEQMGLGFAVSGSIVYGVPME